MKINIKNLLIFTSFLILFFQNLLIGYSKFFGIFDELLAVFFLLYYILFGLRKDKEKFKLFFIVLILIAGGLVFNFYYKIQTHEIAIIEDIVSTFKFIFIFLGVTTFVEKNKEKLQIEKILKMIVPIIKVFLIVLFVFAIINLFYDNGMSLEIRYGMKAFSFIYGTSGHLINQMTYALLILYANRIYMEKKNSFWIVLTIFICISTLKTRAFVLVALYAVFSYLFTYKKQRKLGIQIVLIGIIVLLLGYSQFEHYFLNEGTPRQRFVSGAITLVKEKFPFGTGFGTYGSSAAAKYYSPLYYKLGFYNKYGLSPTDSRFLNDNYLPMIFAQFGIVLAIIFILLVYTYAKLIISKKKNYSSETKLITYFFVFDIIFSSIQSSYLAHYSVVTLSFIYFLFYSIDKTQIGEKNDN